MSIPHTSFIPKFPAGFIGSFQKPPSLPSRPVLQYVFQFLLCVRKNVCIYWKVGWRVMGNSFKKGHIAFSKHQQKVYITPHRCLVSGPRSEKEHFNFPLFGKLINKPLNSLLYNFPIQREDCYRTQGSFIHSLWHTPPPFWCKTPMDTIDVKFIPPVP